MSELHFNKESDYSEKNTSDNENFRSTILQPFQFEPENQKNTCGMRKKLNILTLQLLIYYMLE